MCSQSNFYKAGFIESWGRGYKKIREEFEKAGHPVPTVEERGGGVLVTIRRRTVEDIIDGRGGNGGLISESGGVNGGLNSESGGLKYDYCHVIDINSRQKRILSLIKLKPAIIVEQMATILSISKRTLERDLSMLQKEGIIKHEGSKKSGIWVVLEPYKSKE